MSEPHLNIFHAYRGPTRSENASVRQLETNLTRALMVTLNTIRNSEARIPFLKTLGFPESQALEPYQCRLEVAEQDSKWPPPSRRRLTAIYGGPDLSIVSGSGDARRGRVDAVVATRSYVVAVESKLGAEVERGQLDRHRETLAIPDGPLGQVTWSQLARLTREVRADHRREPVVRYVLQQFEEYLRMNGYGGLTEDHFSYFAQQPDYRDELVKDGIRRSLEELMPEIARTWDSHWQTYVGNIGRADITAWAKIEPDKPGHTPHLSIAINPASLDIFANIETNGPFWRFQSAWEQDSARFIEILHTLGRNWPPTSADDPPWRLSIVRRIPTGRPMKDEYWPATDVAASELAEWPENHLRWFIETVADRPPNEHVPEIKLIRSYSTPVISNDDRLAERLASDAAQLEPFFDWIGEPVRHTSS